MGGPPPAPAASAKQAATPIFRDIGDRLGQTNALDDLATVQHLTGEYPGAIASLTEALPVISASSGG